MKKRRKDYSNRELRLDTPANSEALGRKTTEGLTVCIDSITSELPVTRAELFVFFPVLHLDAFANSIEKLVSAQ